MIRFILGTVAGASAVYVYALLLSYTRETNDVLLPTDTSTAGVGPTFRWGNVH